MSTSLWPQLITSALTASASASASQPHSLSALVQQEAVVITSQLQAHENSSSSSSDNSRSSLADTASFLVELTRFLSQLADCMIDEQRIEAQLERDVDRFEARTDFSELKALDLLNAEHRALKSIASELRTAAATVERLAAEARPAGADRDDDDAMSTGSLELFSIRGSLESSLHIGGSTVLEPLPQQLPTPTDPGRAIAHEPIPELNQLGQSARPPSVTSIFESRLSADPDDIADQIRTILGTRLERGKGNHTCPYGVQCTKGGVVDGKTVVFERNSTFRMHLQRHQKTFMCTVPGCSNRDGFARQDQLLRHQRTIHQRSAPAEGPAQLWKDDGMMLA